MQEKYNELVSQGTRVPNDVNSRSSAQLPWKATAMMKYAESFTST